MPLLALAFLAFIGLGLPDPMPGSLWPELRPFYGVPNAGLGLILAVTAGGYVLAGIFTARLVDAFGIGWLLVASLAATACAALLQSAAPPFVFFVALAALAGAGGGAVDAAMNAFAAARFQPRHMNWLHGFWGVGATLGPATAAALLAAGFGWQAGYLAVGLALALLTLGFLATRRRWQGAGPAEGPRHGAWTVLRNPVARLQVAIFFLYTGLEAGAGQWAATIMTAARGATPAEGAMAATLFFAALTGGRIGLGFVVDRIGADRLLRLLAPVAVLAALGFASGVADLLMLALLAVALAPIYPTIMARTPARLGAAAAAQAVGLQVSAATLGVAVVPAALGLAADLGGAGLVPWLVAGLALVVAVLIHRLPTRRAA
ncbi:MULTISPECIES: MFS transporter [Roseomonadaceae]|uniref:MFS transporter n=1 Tax=Falsiroseomonas oleicola TaxID=2801474 RepID=A0ABS6H8B5_9PROT|nr:MFS transporter [Roseomonas oleicola]MBU8543580.1 MFS transporter [Roseomonas oleicola]